MWGYGVAHRVELVAWHTPLLRTNNRTLSYILHLRLYRSTGVVCATTRILELRTMSRVHCYICCYL